MPGHGVRAGRERTDQTGKISRLGGPRDAVHHEDGEHVNG